MSMDKKLIKEDRDEIIVRNDALYKKHAKHLEQTNHGDYVAIAFDGQIIVEKDCVKLLQEATRRFGSCNFVCRRVGYDYLLKWRRT